MKNVWQGLLGIIIALAAIGLVLGGFSLSLAEGKMTAPPTPTHTLLPTDSPTPQPFTPSPEPPTPSFTSTANPSLTFTPTSTLNQTPPPTNCPPPVGWTPYIIQSGDTLDKIATRFRVANNLLQQANCLPTTGLLPGVVIYVPSTATQVPTQTAVRCGPPRTWIVYIVQPGDTLYHLSQAYGVSVGQLQTANCMGNAILLRTGQTLYVPPWAAQTPFPTIPLMASPTTIPTDTPGIILPSDTPTEIPTLVPTDTPVPIASDTPVEVPTDTLTPATP